MIRIKKDFDLNKLYEKYGFEVGEDYYYEKYHIRDLKNGSWSLVVNDNREVFILSYTFSYDESNCYKKKITNHKIVKSYIKDLIEDNAIVGIFTLLKGQMKFTIDGKIVKAR